MGMEIFQLPGYHKVLVDVCKLCRDRANFTGIVEESGADFTAPQKLGRWVAH